MAKASQNELTVAIADPVVQSKGIPVKYCQMHRDSEEDLSAPSMSNGGDSESNSDSEEIDVSELKRRMWKNQMLLRKLQGITSEQVLKKCNYYDYLRKKCINVISIYIIQQRLSIFSYMN